MSTVLSYILLATSIALSLWVLYLIRTTKALEREFLNIKNKEPTDEVRRLKEEALREIQELKETERLRLENELREKRIQNDNEIAAKQIQIDAMIEAYRIAKENEVNQVYENMVAEAENNFVFKKEEFDEELASYEESIFYEQQKIEQLRRNQIAITEALLREAINKDAYNLHLSDTDKFESNELRTIANKYPRIRSVILKAIYEIYYAPEVKRLISRVVGGDKVSGIYRITSKLDGRVYIGKAVNIKDRWTTHFKRAAGVETETTNLLYPAMREQGLENFSFEVIEKVDDEEKLGEREKYWQSFYQAKEHGFSVR